MGHDERHLGSGMIRGIGPIYASKLEVAFAAEVFELRELASERLREVPGIGKVQAGRIVQAWADQQLVHPNREQQLHWSCLLAILLPLTLHSSCGLRLPLPTGLAVPGQAALAPPQFIGQSRPSVPLPWRRSSWAARTSAWGPRPTARRNGSSTQSWGTRRHGRTGWAAASRNQIRAQAGSRPGGWCSMPTEKIK